MSIVVVGVGTLFFKVSRVVLIVFHAAHFFKTLVLFLVSVFSGLGTKSPCLGLIFE